MGTGQSPPVRKLATGLKLFNLHAGIVAFPIVLIVYNYSCVNPPARGWCILNYTMLSVTDLIGTLFYYTMHPHTPTRMFRNARRSFMPVASSRLHWTNPGAEYYIRRFALNGKPEKNCLVSKQPVEHEDGAAAWVRWLARTLQHLCKKATGL